eukprot:52089-Eustigmatos_ZCMA.PRE.1
MACATPMGAFNTVNIGTRARLDPKNKKNRHTHTPPQTTIETHTHVYEEDILLVEIEAAAESGDRCSSLVSFRRFAWEGNLSPQHSF